MKLGQMQDIRGLFDEKKKCFLKIPIFDVDTAIRKFSKFPHFLAIFDLQRATYRHLQTDFPDTTDHNLSFKKK